MASDSSIAGRAALANKMSEGNLLPNTVGVSSALKKRALSARDKAQAATKAKASNSGLSVFGSGSGTLGGAASAISGNRQALRDAAGN